MSIEKGKIIKITFEYENVKESLSDIQAEEWLNKVNSMCLNLHNRGQNPFHDANFEWNIE